MPAGAPPVAVDAVVTTLADLTHDVRVIRLRVDPAANFEFLAGQFVSFSIERPGQRFSATRAYTISSSPDLRGEIELLLNLIPGGPGSEYLFGLAPGDAVTFRGPYGTFVLPQNDADLLFVATGTGIAPFSSMLAWLAAHEPERRVTLLWGIRSERDLYFQRELEQFVQQMPNFTHLTTLSQPGADWQGARGRVQIALQDRATTVDGLEVYLCGNGAMIKEVAQLLKDRGPCTIHREQYFAAPRTTNPS